MKAAGTNGNENQVQDLDNLKAYIRFFSQAVAAVGGGKEKTGKCMILQFGLHIFVVVVLLLLLVLILLLVILLLLLVGFYNFGQSLRISDGKACTSLHKQTFLRNIKVIS